MKKAIFTFILVSSMILSGCSLLEEVNGSLNYANEVKEQVTTLSTFAEEAPQMFKEAAVNPEVRQELEERLIALKSEIVNFNKIEAPALAESIHQQLIAKNQALLDEINKMVENGNMKLDSLGNSPIFKTINDITGLLNRIEGLGL
jgi:PBP1b-binding outer membrane lipoprotein LpoB